MQILSHIFVKTRTLQISSIKRIPAFRKKEIRPTTFGKSSGRTSFRSLTLSSTVMAFASVNANSWTGEAPDSCKWYEQIFIGIYRSFLKFDYDMLSFILFKYFNANWDKASDDDIEKSLNLLIPLDKDETYAYPKIKIVNKSRI